MTTAVPWREGRWIDAAETLLELRANHSSAEFGALVQTTLGNEGMGNPESARRLKRIGSLAAYADEDPGGDLVRAQARRGELLGASAIQLANGLDLTRTALDEMALRQHPLTNTELAEARAVTAEDLRFVFDFEKMSRCAEVIAIFLIDLARSRHRFDDFAIARDIANLHMSLPKPNGGRSVALGHAMLDFILHEPCMSTEEREWRVAMVPALRTWFAPQLEAGSLPEPLAALFEEATSIGVDSLALDTRPRDYKAEFERLLSRYHSSGDSNDLSDLVFLCSTPCPGETPRQEAIRLNQLGETLYLRGTTTDAPFDLSRAFESEVEVIDLLDPSDPLRLPYIANLARFHLGFLIVGDVGVSPYAEKIRGHLPPLPENPKLAGTREIGVAYATRAVLELAVALESMNDSRELWRDAVAAGDAAIRHLTPKEKEIHLDEVAAVRASALLLGAAREGREMGEESLALLAAAIGEPPSASRARKPALGMVREAIEFHPAARGPLRRVLEELPEPSFETSLLLARLVLAEGDLSGSPEVCDAAARRIGDLIVDADDPEEAEALQLRREAAVQILAKRPATAAAIWETVPGGPPARSIATGNDRCRSARLHLISDRREIAVLASPPDEPWKVVSREPSAELERLTPSRWSEEGSAPPVLAWREWMTELATPLEALLGDILAPQSEMSTRPVLCTTMGFPISLVNWIRPEIELVYAQVAGPITDDVAELVERPLPDDPRVTVLAGPDGASGDETKADAAAIHAAGFAPDLIDSPAARGLLASLRDSNVIHLSGHLFRKGEDILLATGNRSGMIANRFHGLHLDQTRVVTFLSPGGELSPGSMATEITHVARRLLAAGAGAVVTSLGPSFTDPNDFFLSAFYPALGRGASIADAFAAGISAIRNHQAGGTAPYGHPAYWAGITLFTGSSSH